MPTDLRRAILLHRSEANRSEIDDLTQRHHLTVVYTAVTDTAAPRLAVLIAMEHVLNHNAEVVVVPHLTALEMWHDREWLALAELVGLVMADGELLGGRADVVRY
ncbi:hypothetical protein ACFWPH_23030 [Nocardia sp. NPDC058499]|uniref:hypothetical protein n=1 Tax=Nocardia sp. NPDC058499 TaxID=3346530 RepID=UPI00365725F5